MNRRYWRVLFDRPDTLAVGSQMMKQMMQNSTTGEQVPVVVEATVVVAETTPGLGYQLQEKLALEPVPVHTREEEPELVAQIHIRKPMLATDIHWFVANR